MSDRLAELRELLGSLPDETDRARAQELLAEVLDAAREDAVREAQGRAIIANRFAEIARKFPA